MNGDIINRSIETWPPDCDSVIWKLLGGYEFHHWRLRTYCCSVMGLWGFLYSETENCKFNSYSPSAAYMRRWAGSALVQVMACCLLRQAIIWTIADLYGQLDHNEQTWVKFESKYKAFENVSKMAAVKNNVDLVVSGDTGSCPDMKTEINVLLTFNTIAKIKLIVKITYQIECVHRNVHLTNYSRCQEWSFIGFRKR